MTKIQNSKRFEHLAFDIVSNFDIRISNLLFYLLILFLPTQLGRHFFPGFSFVSGVRVDYLAPTLYVTDILILLVFITWVFNLLVRHSGNPDLSGASRISILQRDSGQARMTNKHMGQANFNPFDKLRVVFDPEAQTRRDAERSRSVKFQIGLLVTIILIGIVFSRNQLAGLYGFIKLLEFIFLGFYTAYNFKKLRLDIVLVLFSVGIIFESFLAIFQYLNQTSIGGIFYFLGERTFNSQTPGIANASVNGNLVLRPYGTFSHPNVLAGFLVIAMTMIVSSIKYQVLSIKKIIYLGSVVFGTLALFLTMSRTAILLWLLIVGLWFISYNWQKLISGPLGRHSGKPKAHPESPYVKSDSGQAVRRPELTAEWARMTDKYIYLVKSKNLKLKILIVGFVGVILLLSPLRFRFADIRLSDESIIQRGELTKDSFSMIKSHPIFGVGLNNFLVELPKVHRQDANVFYLQPVHNIFLLVTAQTGIVGLIFFLWFIGKTFKNVKCQMSNVKSTSKNLKSKKENLIINPLSSIVALSAILILGLFDHYFLTLQQGQLLFSFILGLCWAKSSQRNV